MEKIYGLPFVFAAWVSNKKLDSNFINLSITNRFGLKKINQVVKANPYSTFNLKDYYTKYINYHLDSDKVKDWNCFLKKFQQINR